MDGYVTHIRIPGRIGLPGAAEIPLSRDPDLLSAIIDGLSEAIYAKDTKSRFIYANVATARAMGAASPDDLIGKTDFDFYPEEFAAKFFADEQQIVRTGQGIKETEERRADPSGRSVWQLSTKVPLRDEPGSIIGLVGVSIDVTDVRGYEDALASERRLLRTIVDLIPDWIYAKDTASRFIFGNTAVAQNAGFETPEGLIGKTDFDLAPEELAREYFVDEQELMATGESFRDKVEPGIYPDGTVKWVLSTKVPLRDGEGRVVGLVGLGRDVTERKRADDAVRRYQERLEEEVARRTAELQEANARLQLEIAERERGEALARASEERYRILYEDTPSMYFTVEPDGTILAVNEFGAAQLGYTVAELVGRPVATVFADEERSAAAGYIAECVANPGEVFHWELRKVHKDGTHVVVKETARAAPGPEGELVVMIVCEDVTARKEAEGQRARLETELRQAQKMEAIGRLAGGVAHDFNNLLTAITGYTDLLLAALAEDDPLRRDADEVRKASERAASLTRQLLAFSRQQPLNPESIDLNEVVSEMENLLRRLIGEDVELVTTLAPGLPAVFGDRGQLEQVIVNLAVNARDAMPEGGKLVIQTTDAGPPAPGVGTGATEAVLSVSDTGVGMDEAVRSRIFEPFFTTKEHGHATGFGGTGLGLSTVYGIVEQNGGRIETTSVPDVGTTFRIYLPTAPAGAPARPALTPRLERGSETVLLVEDEGLIRSLAARVLREQGYTVLEAADGDEALRLAGEHQGEIALALTDVIMPGMSGFELGERLRAGQPELPMIFMSGHTDPTVGRRGVAPEGDAFLAKPFAPTTLLGKIREVLDTPQRTG